MSEVLRKQVYYSYAIQYQCTKLVTQNRYLSLCLIMRKFCELSSVYERQVNN